MSFKHCDTLNPSLSSFLDWKTCSQYTYISNMALHMSYIPWTIKLVIDLRLSGPINELGSLRCVNVTWRYRFIVTYSHTQTHSNPKKKWKKSLILFFSSSNPISNGKSTRSRKRCYPQTIRGSLFRFSGMKKENLQNNWKKYTNSPNQVPATRAAAELVLTQFRQVPKVLPACQYILGNLKASEFLGKEYLWFNKILEHASTSMVQFQISLAIGDIAVRDYTLYDKLDLLQLKNFMIEFCLQREK